MAKNKNNQKSNIQIEAHFGLQLRYSSATVKRSVVAAGDLSFFFVGSGQGIPATDEKSIRHDAKPEKSMHRNPKNKKSLGTCATGTVHCVLRVS